MTSLRPTLLHVFPTFAIGGQQTRFATVANRLGREFRHRLVSLDGRNQAVALLDRDLDFALLPDLPPTANPIERLHRIVSTIAAARPDALITYNWGSIEWAMVNQVRFRRPHIHLEDGFGADEADRQKRHRILVRSLFLRRSTVVVPSCKLAEIAVRLWRIDPQRVNYIPNGIDPLRFNRISGTGAPFFLRREGECIVGSFSPLRREKNIGRLLRAFAPLSRSDLRICLVICGDGPELATLKQLACRLEIAHLVTFAGHIPQPEAVMGAFDVFAITSDTEQMPYAVLEAMASGLPVLATDVGDIAIMVAEENRQFVVPRDDPDALTSALARLCTAGDLRRRLGQRNRQRIEQTYGIGPTAAAFHRILSAATARR